MLRKRVIPVLLLRGESLVKTVKFNRFRYIGDPCNTVRIFNELEVNNKGLKNLGFNPITLSNSLIDDIKFIALEMKSNLKPENILTSPKW